jgi:hypothetical protein
MILDIHFIILAGILLFLTSNFLFLNIVILFLKAFFYS